MYPNLLGQKAYHHLTNEEMGELLGITRQAFENKLVTGRFTVNECKTLCKYFNKSFDYLFALNDQLMS